MYIKYTFLDFTIKKLDRIKPKSKTNNIGKLIFLYFVIYIYSINFMILNLVMH